jgi:hypothetical protein
MVSFELAINLVIHTSLRDFGKRQASTPLQINIVGIYQGAQGSKRFAREKVGLGALKKSISQLAISFSQVK